MHVCMVFLVMVIKSGAVVAGNPSTPAPPGKPNVACWASSFNGCLSLVLAPNCMCRCSGPLKAQGLSITPDLAPGSLGYFAAVSPDRMHWGVRGSSLAPWGLGHAEYRRVSAAPPWLVATSSLPQQR